jgi:hypothetical protein
MRAVFPFLIVALVWGCSPPPARETSSSADSIRSAPPPPPAQTQPAAIKENASIIGAVIIATSAVDSLHWTMTLEIRTALPKGGGASLAEPGQRITVTPAYLEGEGGTVSLEVPRNRRLQELRSRKVGEAVLGTVTLRDDGIWYLVDTEF